MNKRKTILIIAGLALIGGVGTWYYKDRSPNVAPQPQQSASTTVTESSFSHLSAFETALNAGDWEKVKESLAPTGTRVYLAGSECCTKKFTPEEVLIYLKFRNIKFSFNEEDPLVREQIQKELEDWVPSLHPEEYIWGVENDPAQPNKTAVGYKASAGFVTSLLIRKGRDGVNF